MLPLADTFRNGQQAAVAVDIIALMDALEIDRAIIGGFDWGSRTACVMAALWPERCKALVSVSGYLITSLKANLQPLPPAAELGWWYQYYFATERGVRGYSKNRHDFNKLIWKSASPKWNFDDATFERTAASFNNPDHVAIVIHNYRWRLSLAKGDPQYDALEQKLAATPVIAVPTITIASDFDGPAADGTSYRKTFSGKYSHRVLKESGTTCLRSPAGICTGHYRRRSFLIVPAPTSSQLPQRTVSSHLTLPTDDNDRLRCRRGRRIHVAAGLKSGRRR